MKKTLIPLTALAFALVLARPAAAQEPSKYRFAPADSLPAELHFETYDSLARHRPYSPDFRAAEPGEAVPAVSMTSVAVIPQNALPARVTVLDNNTLRMGRHFNISNGKAENWGPFPDAYLDARTLSFPLPR